LGLTISENLDWKEHVNKLNTKIRSFNGIFFKYKNYLSKFAAKSIYYAYIHSRLNYGIEIYGIANRATLHPLEISCNKILRTLQNVPYTYHTKDLYINYNTVPVNDLFKLALYKLMHKCIHDSTTIPPVILSKFNFNRNIHNYFTRNNNDFNFNSNYNSKDPLSLATHMWNNIPTAIKTCQNTFKFNVMVKNHVQQTIRIK